MARQTLLIHARVSDVFAVLVDVEKYPAWMDGVREIQVQEVNSQGEPSNVAMTLEGMGFRDTLTLSYQWGEHHVSWHLLNASIVSKLHGTFRLQAEGADTLVDYELDADVNISLPGFMKQAGVANIVKATMHNLKARCEG